MDNKKNLIELLEYINPAILDYQEWVNVGMAMKHEGLTAQEWDQWSQADPRYKPGECFRKWETFQGSSAGKPVTGGTIYQMAVENGYSPVYMDFENSHALNWDDEISNDGDYKFIDKSWIEGKEIQEPTHWQPAQELITYLETLFQSTENVGFVTETYPLEDKEGNTVHKPKKGVFDRTAGHLIEKLHKYKDDIGFVIGDYNKEAGAWIRFNPLDGKGVKNDNVTEFRYALVESDRTSISQQNAIIRELELPVACLVHSGGKSVHAIVKIDARDYHEYQKRVDYLYKVCAKNGLAVDTQNKNPSRLSRMPGVVRNGRKQFLIDTNIGKQSWDEWFEYIEDLNDDLPDPENLEDFWDDMPDLAPELIKGVLRQGHKMLIAGPSKAGKSFALIEMAIAIAEGKKWLNWECAQGRVLYVNLELDRASCLHRFKDVYTSMGLSANNLQNVHIWNLRGKTVPMDKLAPKLIRRAHKKNYTAVIIDPIYKVLTGDENSADQMAHFTNQFDKVATELGCSVIYCHHHSKGSQGGKKSMDRASGSGVFARDPDALIDLVELDIPETLLKTQINNELVKYYEDRIKTLNNKYYITKIGMDDHYDYEKMKYHAEQSLSGHLMEVRAKAKEIEAKVKQQTAWRVEGTLREFAKFEPVNIWFNYPKHTIDDVGVLADLEADSNDNKYSKAKKGRAEQNSESNKDNMLEFEMAVENCVFEDEEPTKKMVADYLGVSVRTIERKLENSKKFRYDKDSKTIKKVATRQTKGSRDEV